MIPRLYYRKVFSLTEIHLLLSIRAREEFKIAIVRFYFPTSIIYDSFTVFFSQKRSLLFTGKTRFAAHCYLNETRK